jgi:hypothetical protein
MTPATVFLSVTLAVCVLGLIAIFRKRRLKLQFKSWLGTFSFETDDDSRPDA